MSQDNGTATFDPKKTREVLAMISRDMMAEARAMDGKPFNAPVVGECLGCILGTVSRLAKILDAQCQEIEELKVRLAVAEAFARSGCPCEVAS